MVVKRDKIFDLGRLVFESRLLLNNFVILLGFSLLTSKIGNGIMF